MNLRFLMPMNISLPFYMVTTKNEKLRKIGNLLRKIAKEGFITKTISGKQWIITEKGEQELNY